MLSGEGWIGFISGCFAGSQALFGILLSERKLWIAFSLLYLMLRYLKDPTPLKCSFRYPSIVVSSTFSFPAWIISPFPA